MIEREASGAAPYPLLDEPQATFNLIINNTEHLQLPPILIKI
jgi:hypothetical protein